MVRGLLGRPSITRRLPSPHPSKSAWTLPSCGREERAHKDLENRRARGFPQRPHASPLHRKAEKKKNEAFNRLTHEIPDTSGCHWLAPLLIMGESETGSEVLHRNHVR